MSNKIPTLKPLKTKRRWSWWRIAAVTFSVLLIAATAMVLTLRRKIPPEMMKDIRAGISARHIANPDDRIRAYLTARYGSMSDPANRQKAFMDFFNVEHIKALQLMVKHAPKSQKRANIEAMSRWIKNFRESLTPQERMALRSKFQSSEGREMLKQATALYNSQDVQYRGQTAVVISQLLKTIYAAEIP